MQYCLYTSSILIFIAWLTSSKLPSYSSNSSIDFFKFHLSRERNLRQEFILIFIAEQFIECILNRLSISSITCFISKYPSQGCYWISSLAVGLDFYQPSFIKIIPFKAIAPDSVLGVTNSPERF